MVFAQVRLLWAHASCLRPEEVMVCECRHGGDPSRLVTRLLGDPDRTACCGAFWSIGDAGPYCKCCFASVEVWS